MPIHFVDIPLTIIGNSSYSVINIVTYNEELFNKKIECNIKDGQSLVSTISEKGAVSFK